MQITVTSYQPLSSTQQKELEKVLSAKFTDAEIGYKVDESVVAGLQIKIGSQLYDLSAANKIARIADYLGTHAK